MSTRIRFCAIVALTLCLTTWDLWGQDAAAVGVVSQAIRAGNYAQADASANEALQKDPRNIKLLTLRGIALSKLNKQDEAVKAFRAALAVDASYVPALAGVAQLEYRGASDAAVRDLDALLRLRPNDETAHAMRASVAFQRRDCRGAVEHFSKADDVIRTQPAAMKEFAWCLESLGQDERAIDVLQPLAAGHDPEALKLSSRAHERRGDTPQAVQLQREAILAAPDRVDLYLDFVGLCFDHNSFQVGVDVLNAGLTRLPQSAKLYLARGVMFAQMGEYDKADDDFERAETLDPREIAGTDARALADFQADRLDSALGKVEEDVRRDPRNPFPRYLLAEILIRRGAHPGSAEFARAVSAAKAALRLKPDFTLAGDVLSRLYLESVDTQAAIAQCRATLATDPDDEVALYRLIRALKASSAPRAQEELPNLTKRLATLRAEARKKEEQASRYRLVETPQANQH